MKLSFIITLIFTLNAAASAYSQATKMSMELSDATLVEVIEAIKQQSEFKFLYNHEEVEQVKNLNINFENATVEEILDQALADYDLGYRVENEVVVIVPEPGKIMRNMEPPVEVEAPKIKYTGKVVDGDGNPVPFAAVVIKGTTLGTATAGDGTFVLEVEEGNYTSLVASSIGFVSNEIVIGNNTNFQFVLLTDVSGLDEVLITGYQSISKERATGSFGKIQVEQLEKPSSSISERLVGSTAGVQTTINPDGTIDFEIRGQSSLLADAQPLVVVDGFPILQGKELDKYGQVLNSVDPFATINPNDVESVTVLKDAAAASIWGAKSANGVIVITTKNARKGKANVEFSSFLKVSPMLDLDQVNPRASAEETIEYERLGYASNRFGTVFPPPFYATFAAGSPWSQAFVAMFKNTNGMMTDEQMESELTRLAAIDNRGQIKDELMRNPFTQQYNLSITGGNQVMSNNLSLMYENRKNNFKENNIDKFMVNFRNRIEITKWLDFDFSGMMSYDDKTSNGVQMYGLYGDLMSEIAGLSPYDNLRDANGELTNLNNSKYFTPVLEDLVPTENFPVSDWSYNPVAEINERDFSTKDLNARVQAGLTVKLIKGLSINSKIMYETLMRNTKNIYNANSFAMREMLNETSTWDQRTGAVTQNMPYGGGLQQNSYTYKNYNFRNQLNFVRTFAEKHAINFVAGSEISSRVVEFKNEPDVFGYDDEKLTVGRMLTPIDQARMWTGYPMAYASYFYPIDLEGVHEFRYNTDRYFSMYGNLAYTYNEKYTVSGSVRTDASNLITDDPQYRYSPFWSLGGSWQAGKEEFLKDVSWVDRLTVRGTYGYSGNVDRTTSFMPLLNISGTANYYTQETTASIGSYGNPTLRWEKTRSINFGADYSLWNSKLYGSIDVYHKHGSDLIVSQSIAAINGTSSQKFNNGEMVNKGVELTVGTSLPLKGKDITWNGNLNFAYNHNEITSLFMTTYNAYTLTNGGTGAYVEGENANALWSYVYGGMQNLGTEADPKMAPTVKGEGDEYYPLTSWVPGSDHRGMLSVDGTRVAPFIMGFHNRFKVYDFDLSFIFTGKFGHVYRSHGFNYPSMIGGNTNVNNKFSEVANGDPNEIIPIPEREPRYYFYDRFYPYMSYLTESASHIRFQEINLTYNLPRRLTHKIGLNNVRVFAQANNLGVLTFNGLDEDPEYPVGTYKPQATFTFGLKVNL